MRKVEHKINLNRLDFNLNKRGDLISFDGPFLSHFYDDRGKEYLLLWIDKDKIYNRWLLFEIDAYLLYFYFNKKYSLKDLIFKNKTQIAYIVDYDSELNSKRIYLINQKEIPEEYLPNKSSYFESNYSTEYANGLSREIIRSFTKNRNRVRSHKSFRDIPVRYINATGSNVEEIHKLRNNVRVLEASRFPLEVLHDKYRENNIYHYLMHKTGLAIHNPVVNDMYFYELGREIRNFISPNISLEYSDDKEQILRNLIVITIELVQKNPSYKKSFKLWKSEILLDKKISKDIQEILETAE